jgi:hypothetical protein
VRSWLSSRVDDSLVRRLLRQVVHVVDHGNEQVEEEFATILHLVLHCATALEGVTSSDDEGEIVCAKLRVVVGCVGVCEACRAEYGRALDS